MSIAPREPLCVGFVLKQDEPGFKSDIYLGHQIWGYIVYHRPPGQRFTIFVEGWSAFILSHLGRTWSSELHPIQTSRQVSIELRLCTKFSRFSRGFMTILAQFLLNGFLVSTCARLRTKPALNHGLGRRARGLTTTFSSSHLRYFSLACMGCHSQFKPPNSISTCSWLQRCCWEEKLGCRRNMHNGLIKCSRPKWGNSQW